MAAYRRVYDSRHLQADCQEPGSAPEPYTLGNRVWAIPLPYYYSDSEHSLYIAQRARSATTTCNYTGVQSPQEVPAAIPGPALS